MTNQEAFNTAYRAHVLEGKRLGFKLDGVGSRKLVTCVYSKGCAVGVNLTPAEMEEILENEMDDGMSVNDLYEYTPEFSVFQGTDRSFLTDMQTAHDSAANFKGIEGRWENWGTGHFRSGDKERRNVSRRTHVQRNYETVAKYYGLSIPS